MSNFLSPNSQNQVWPLPRPDAGRISQSAAEAAIAEHEMEQSAYDAHTHLVQLERERDRATSTEEAIAGLDANPEPRKAMEALAEAAYKSLYSTPYVLKRVFEKHIEIETVRFENASWLSRVSRKSPVEKAASFAFENARYTPNAYLLAKIIDENHLLLETTNSPRTHDALYELKKSDPHWEERQRGEWAPRENSPVAFHSRYRSPTSNVDPRSAYVAFLPTYNHINYLTNSTAAVEARRQRRPFASRDSVGSVQTLPAISEDVSPPEYPQAAAAGQFWQDTVQLAPAQTSPAHATHSGRSAGR
jgi:hypothetical protein